MRVAFVANTAKENGALGGWGSVRMRFVEFKDNWSLRGSALFQNRAKRIQPQLCSTQEHCGWLEQCYAGSCEPSISIGASTFTNNVATGDFGGAIARGSSGFDISMAIGGTEMYYNNAPLYGTAIASISSDTSQSRPFAMDNSSILTSPANRDKSAIYMYNAPEWKLQAVDFAGQFHTGMVAANTKAAGCASAPTAPCPTGFGCSVVNQSIQCIPCAVGMVSDGRESCRNCEPGSGPTRAQHECESCKDNEYSAAGICKPCLHVPNMERTACEACPPMHVPDADGLGCVQCASGQIPSADGRRCICTEGRYDRKYGFIFCFELGWKPDPIRAASSAFSQKAKVELASGNPCLPCPDCVQCTSSGAAPVPNAGWALSPLAEQIWTEGLNTNTTPYVLDPGLIEKMILENGAGSAERQAREFRSQHMQHVNDPSVWRSSFAAYEQDCLSRMPATAATCSETFTGEDELNGYCDFDRSTQTCRPATHRLSLNRSLFKCVDMGGKTSCNPAEAQPGVQRRRSQATNSSLRASQCAPRHSGTLCGECDAPNGRLFMPAMRGGMQNQCEPCENGGAKFALTLFVLAVLAVVVFGLIRYLEKQSAKLDDLRAHYTILSKVHQAASHLRGDEAEAVAEEVESQESILDTVRVIVGNLQIISALPIVFEAKFVEHIHFSKWIFELRDLFQLDIFGLMSLDCLIRGSIYVRFCFTLAIPTFLVVFIQARAALHSRTRKQNARVEESEPGLGGAINIMSVVTAKKLAHKAKARLTEENKRRKNAAMGLSFAVRSQLKNSYVSCH